MSVTILRFVEFQIRLNDLCLPLGCRFTNEAVLLARAKRFLFGRTTGGTRKIQLAGHKYTPTSCVVRLGFPTAMPLKAFEAQLQSRLKILLPYRPIDEDPLETLSREKHP